MSPIENGAAPDQGAARSVSINGQDVLIERLSARKASRAIAELRALSKAIPGLQTELARFRREYEAENVVELDRVQARLEYPTRLLLNDDGDPVMQPQMLEDGSPNPTAGHTVVVPSPVDRMTEADWAAAGGVLRRPMSPTNQELVAAIFDHAIDVAEERVYRLLALFTLTNAEVKAWRRDGTLDEKLNAKVDELLDDADATELLELAVTIGELVDGQFTSKAAALGARLGNLGRLIGWTPPTSPSPTPAPPSIDIPSSSRPTSSTDSPANTEEAPTPSLTSPGTSPSSSPPASAPTTNDSAPTRPLEPEPAPA